MAGLFKGNKDQVTKKYSRKFEYEKGEVTLGVTLRTDIKTQMQDYLAILEVSKEEVEAELAKLG